MRTEMRQSLVYNSIWTVLLKHRIFANWKHGSQMQESPVIKQHLFEPEYDKTYLISMGPESNLELKSTKEDNSLIFSNTNPRSSDPKLHISWNR